MDRNRLALIALIAYGAGAYVIMVAAAWNVFGRPQTIDGYFSAMYVAGGVIAGLAAAALCQVVSPFWVHAIMVAVTAALGFCSWFFFLALAGI